MAQRRPKWFRGRCLPQLSQQAPKCQRGPSHLLSQHFIATLFSHMQLVLFSGIVGPLAPSPMALFPLACLLPCLLCPPTSLLQVHLFSSSRALVFFPLVSLLRLGTFFPALLFVLSLFLPFSLLLSAHYPAPWSSLWLHRNNLHFVSSRAPGHVHHARCVFGPSPHTGTLLVCLVAGVV